MNSRQFISLILLCCLTLAGVTTYANPEPINTSSLFAWWNRKNNTKNSLNETLLQHGSSEDLSDSPPAALYGATEETSPINSPRPSSSRSLTPPSSPNRSSSDSLRSNSPISSEGLLKSQPPRLVTSYSDPSSMRKHILPSPAQRRDITPFMRRAYKGDWEYFRDLTKRNNTVSGSFKNLFAPSGEKTDNNGQTALHWGIKGSKRGKKALTMHWLTLYLKQQLEPKTFKKVFLQKNHDDKTMADLLLDQYIQKPFDINDPETDTIPYLYYGLYLNELKEPRMFGDMLAWAVARNKMLEVRQLIKLFIKYENKYPRDIETISGKGIRKYIQTPEMSNLLESLNDDYLEMLCARMQKNITIMQKQYEKDQARKKAKSPKRSLK